MSERTKRPPHEARDLIKAVAFLQLKLLLDAVRDLALSPLAIVAALVDLVCLKQRSPTLFRAVLRFGEHTDRWIDVWSGWRDAADQPHENVDTLLARIEEAVRDPKTGARRARILRRWAERQMQHARRQAEAELARRRIVGSAAEPPPPPPSHPPRGDMD